MLDEMTCLSILGKDFKIALYFQYPYIIFVLVFHFVNSFFIPPSIGFNIIPKIFQILKYFAT